MARNLRTLVHFYIRKENHQHAFLPIAMRIVPVLSGIGFFRIPVSSSRFVGAAEGNNGEVDRVHRVSLQVVGQSWRVRDLRTVQPRAIPGVARRLS